MDGVICDNNSFHRTSWIEYAKQLGKDLTEEEIITKVYGKTNKDIVEFCLGRTASTEEINYHGETKEALFREMYAPYFTLAPGLEDFLQNSKSLGVKIGLATNAPLSNMEFAIKAGKLSRFISHFTSAIEVETPKPSPDIYLLACQKLEIHPQNAVVFEDSLTGLIAGKAAGCNLIAISTTYPVETLLEYTPHVYPDFTNLSAEIIYGLFSS